MASILTTSDGDAQSSVKVPSVADVVSHGAAPAGRVAARCAPAMAAPVASRTLPRSGGVCPERRHEQQRRGHDCEACGIRTSLVGRCSRSSYVIRGRSCEPPV